MSSSGNVALYALEKVNPTRRYGRGHVWLSIKTSIVDEKGIDLAQMRELKETRRGRIGEYAEANASAGVSSPSGMIWDVRARSLCRVPPRTSSTSAALAR